MTKGGQRGARGQVDSQDRIMGGFATLSRWAENNRRLATMAGLAILAAGAAAFVYLDYRADLSERAAVRLDQIRLASRAAAPAELRSQLTSYVEQFGSTRHGDEGRLLLAEMELDRGDVESAVRLIDPVVDPDDEPLGYNAAWMLAVAEEQRGNHEAAAEWYAQLARSAPHEFQRRGARAARARLHVYAGEYAAAESIYTELADADVEGSDAEFYAVKLGEVRALAAAKLPPPTLPSIPEPTTAEPPPGATDGLEDAPSSPAAEDEPEAASDE